MPVHSPSRSRSETEWPMIALTSILRSSDPAWLARLGETRSRRRECGQQGSCFRLQLHHPRAISKSQTRREDEIVADRRFACQFLWSCTFPRLSMMPSFFLVGSDGDACVVISCAEAILYAQTDHFGVHREWREEIDNGASEREDQEEQRPWPTSALSATYTSQLLVTEACSARA